MLLIIVVLFTQANGPLGAWSADLLRATLGPTRTAQIEAWYLGITDHVQQVVYHVSGKPATAPWRTGSAPTRTPAGPPRTQPFIPMPLAPITSALAPALPGEGDWTTSGTPASLPNQAALVYKTFVRPDAARPYAIVTLIQFDHRLTTLHLVGGTQEPGGPRGVAGTGRIPTADLPVLLAAFNGGFKYADGHYGMMAHGVTYAPPLAGQATIAMTASGDVILGAWGRDPQLTLNNPHLVAWRQNAALLIDHGVVNPLTSDGAAWGGTILNSVYTWRSGIGITAAGDLIYAGGNALSAATLGKAMQAAGAVMAMQTDINPFWVRAFFYQHASNGSLQITKLNPAMAGRGNEYLQGNKRDFFYVTRRGVPSKP